MDNNKTLEIILKAKDEASKVLSNFSKNTTKLTGTLKTVGKKVALFGVGVAAVTTGVVLGFKKIMEKTTDLSINFNENFAKMNTVFEGVEGKAKEMSDRLSGSFAISQKGITGMIANTGDLLTGFGFTKDGALDLTDQIITLAADLNSASPDILNTEEAVDKLRKGFLGETENLKSLGIIITQNAMKQKASEEGLSTNLKTLSEAEKIQLRYKIAIDQSQNSIGDFDRTSDSVAKTQQRFKVQVEDTMTTIGTELEPVKRKILDFGASALSSFNDALPSMIDFAGELVNVAKTGEKTNETVSDLPAPLQKMADHLLIVTVTVRKAIDKIKEFIKKVQESETVNAILTLIKEQFEKLWEKVKELWEALKPYTPMLEMIAKIIGGVLLGAFLWFMAALKWNITLLVSFLDMFRGIYNFIKEHFIGAIKDDIKKALETAGNAFEWLKETVKGIFESIMGFIQPAIDAISNLFGKLDGIKNKASDVIGNIGSGVKSFFSGGKATGGAVSSSRSYVVGEKGPELFTPNESGVITPNNISNGTTININVTGNQLLDRNSGKIIAEAIFRDFKLKTNLA